MALPCANFYEFKKLLTKLRDEDDKVIYRLNALLPTASFSDKVSYTNISAQHFENECFSLNA